MLQTNSRMSNSSNSDYSYKEPLKKPHRGAFIVIEGLDRAGKTTQVKGLCDRLYNLGKNVENIRFPDRTTPMGKMIDSYLQSKTEMDDHTIHLLFSANRWEKAKWIQETLLSGTTIICDRYYYSGLIYSAAKQNPSLSLAWARHPDVGLPKPDLVIFLDLEPEEAEKRGGYGEEKYEKRVFQEQVRRGFLDLRWCGGEEERDMKVVNAGRGLDEVGEGIWKEVERVVEIVEKGQRAEVEKVKAWVGAEEILEKFGSFEAARKAEV